MAREDFCLGAHWRRLREHERAQVPSEHMSTNFQTSPDTFLSAITTYRVVIADGSISPACAVCFSRCPEFRETAAARTEHGKRETGCCPCVYSPPASSLA
jgi:hypothetical protein